MNKVMLIGNLARDPNVTYNQGGLCIARFPLAVNKIGKDGEQKADFPGCVAFGKTAEIISGYTQKGSKIGVEGRIQTGSYTNRDGQTVYTTDVVVERVDLLGTKGAQQGQPTDQQQAAPLQGQQMAQPQQPADGNPGETGFMQIPDGADDVMPFN